MTIIFVKTEQLLIINDTLVTKCPPDIITYQYTIKMMKRYGVVSTVPY